MNEEALPPTPLPPASQPPYPAHPAPHAHHEHADVRPTKTMPPQAVERTGPTLGQIALVGGGIAVALGIAWSFTRKPTPAPKARKKPQPGKKPQAKKKG